MQASAAENHEPESQREVIITRVYDARARLRFEAYGKCEHVKKWFGPKGFASVLYGLLVLGSGAPGAELMFHVIVVAIVFSIVAHSSTDVPIAGWFARREAEDAERARRDAAVGGDEART